MLLGIRTLKKIDEVIVDEGGQRNVRSNEKPDPLLDRHLQMSLGFGQLGNTIERRSTSRLMIFEML